MAAGGVIGSVERRSSALWSGPSPPSPASTTACLEKPAARGELAEFEQICHQRARQGCCISVAHSVSPLAAG
jgi:hypothetical protein